MDIQQIRLLFETAKIIESLEYTIKRETGWIEKDGIMLSGIREEIDNMLKSMEAMKTIVNNELAVYEQKLLGNDNSN